MAILKRAQSSIQGLPAALTSLQDNIDAEAQARADADGILSTLVTTNKQNLVLAINEVFSTAAEGRDNATIARQEVSDLDAVTLKAASNLSDLADIAVARGNLQTLSETEIEALIDAAKLAGGVSYDVATIAARDALTGLTTADRVWVADDGDTKWAIYKPTAVDGTGKGTAWLKLYDEDALTNSLTAAGIKAAYESNDDTNAFTDAEKAKLAYITVAAAVDLAALAKSSDVVAKASLVQDLEGGTATDAAPSVKAVVDYVAAHAGSGGVQAALENVVVTDGQITLANAPAGGLAGVLNFATVRYITGGVAYDAPVVATADPKVFDVSTDTANQWDGNTVQVQYVY
ncbi:tail fiber protein [Pseudomonas phage PhiPA3]|uniref:Putative tail fibre protein n=1 Tax=Pseudomonas phage PhiPA3 TaxID=998086 RepID=F8SK41_BPPA3|nr:tail fiber protein [Pseudomonas phage PhiPA3]AEH03591.1 putative tail fibre protein [Pseudomonas phage PhiPA3]